MERRRRTLGWLALLAVGLLAFFLLRYPVRGFRLPMGPDAPVYVWWANLAKLDGLSVANWRPGIPALTLLLGGTLGLAQSTVAAGVGAICAATIGLAGAAIVLRPGRPAWVALLAGALTGMFAVHLAGGYFSNVVFAALFLAVLALLSRAVESPAAIVAAAALLGAGGAAHPLFLIVGVVVLLVALPFVEIEDRAAIWLTAVGGAGITGASLLAMSFGPRPLAVDTSADAFFRRAGFGAELKQEFLDRLGHHIARYVPWLLLPLAWFGRKEERGTTLRLLESFALVCLGGLAASFVIPSLPGVRMIAFAYALPILGALGILRMERSTPQRAVAVALVVLVGGIMLWGSALTWFRERPYANPATVAQIRAAGEIASPLPAGTPLVFVVNENDDSLVAFRATNAGNLLRAYLPPDRIPDVHVFVGTAPDFLAERPTLNGQTIHDRLSRTYLADLQAAGVSPQNAKVFVLTGLNPAGLDASQVGGATFLSSTGTDLPSPWVLVLAGAAAFALLAAVGWGWAYAATRDALLCSALSPAFGMAALILGAIVLDRLGVRLTGAVPPVASALLGLGGYGFAWRARRQVAAVAQPASQIDE